MHPTSHHWKEAHRLQAWHLLQQGWPQHEIAEAMGVSAAGFLPVHPAGWLPSRWPVYPISCAVAPKPLAFADSSGPAREWPR